MSPVRQEDDPSVPGPWRALFDPDSSLRYFWNPLTNLTQYEHPVTGVCATGRAAAPAPAAALVPLCETPAPGTQDRPASHQV